ncbi:hypothetical protein F511_46133 [Dorcoceras hygrometricum]|uniref:Uncharacterized protein n=1 Tax=Dorcoceras hygrometricum TaxID=472368 RepID=A0A2Z6ZVE2_9LAMI|nr:hypothetical protein F511_46133 [Dorcoceras hygrometricum]
MNAHDVRAGRATLALSSTIVAPLLDDAWRRVTRGGRPLAVDVRTGCATCRGWKLAVLVDAYPSPVAQRRPRWPRERRRIAARWPRDCATLAGRMLPLMRCWSTHAAHWLRTMRATRATLCVCRRDFFVAAAAGRPPLR